MIINVTYDASASSAPAGFQTAVQAAVQYLESIFSNDVTINISVGWGEVGGETLPAGSVASSTSAGYSLSYDELRNAFWADAATPDALAAALALPATDPTNGGTFYVPAAEAKALGLIDPNGSALDGSIGLDSSTTFTFDPNNRAVPGAVDAIGAIEHEITEILGRTSLAGAVQPDGTSAFGPLDLFRYTAPGALAPTAGNAFFSIDGKTMLQAFDNPANGGDSGDWAQTVHGDSFDAFADTGQAMTMTAVDLREMDVLGYHAAPTTPATPTPTGAATSQGVTVTEVTAPSPDYQVGAGQSLYFKDVIPPLDIYLNCSPYGPALTFENAGTIWAIGTTGYGAAAITTTGVESFYDGGPMSVGAQITNAAGGAIYVDAAIDSAYGVYGGATTSVLNSGVFQIVADNGYAIGAEGVDSLAFDNKAGGTFTVSGVGRAWGVNFTTVGAFSNEGLFQVIGHHDPSATSDSTIGVQSPTTFNNSGTIRVEQIGGSNASIGVLVDEGDGLSKTDNDGNVIGIYTNSGTIQADIAFEVEAQINATLNNSGNLIGVVEMAGPVETLNNSGAIGGDVYLDGQTNTYDGTGGHLYGDLHLGHGTNTVTLGSNGEFVFGGGGTETVTGGAGNDYYEIARGTDSFNGGGGFNTLSFADSAGGWTVNLGTGTATGPGTVTFSNVQQVIGSDFNNTLIAGSTAATLVAGAGHDTLTGGAGNDVLTAGAGGDAMTGGGGNNTFNYSSGDHQLVITDFNAHGDKDTLNIYGYISPMSVVQKGTDTLITLSATDSILLKNVLAPSLAGVNYFAGANQGPLFPSLPTFGSQTVYFDWNLTIGAGETLSMTGEDTLLDDFGTTKDTYHDLSSLDNFGKLSITNSASATGFYCDYGNFPTGPFKNEAGASLTVTSTGGDAFGTNSYNTFIGLSNSGQITVTAAATAEGVASGWSSGLVANNAGGTITVTSTGGDAYGVHFDFPSDVQNDSTITVKAAGTAYGVWGGISGLDSLTNTGTITATSTGGGQSYGVFINGFYVAGAVATVTNSGTITAQTAIYAGTGNTNGMDVHISNSGTLMGDVTLAGTAATLVNTGKIVGNILLHDDAYYVGSSATVDLRGGSFSGFISIAPGTAGDYAVADTIYTGADATTIKIAGGESKLTAAIIGGSGGTTVDFDIASTAATITKSGSSYVVAAGTDGTETLTNVATLVFTDKTVKLIGQPAITDFNADGDSDILWQNANGQAAIWTMNGLTQTGGAQVGGNPGPSWHVIGSGDFDGDGKADILWQNDSGQAAIWTMNGLTQTGGATVGGNPGASWHVKAAADFNGDGKADILWQNDNGQAAIWTMNGLTQTGGATVGGNPGPTWHVVAAADFDGDGKADILWQNDNGQVAIWTMNGLTQIGGATVGGNPGPSWHVKAAADFNGDGKADILWQNDNGQAAIWLMNGLTQIGGAQVGGNPGPTWHIVGAGDYNGDGKADILWQNDSGQAAIWTMDGLTQIGGSTIGGNPGATWHLEDAADPGDTGAFSTQSQAHWYSIWAAGDVTQALANPLPVLQTVAMGR